jgi:hypothetical protein
MGVDFACFAVGNYKAMELDFRLDPATLPTKNNNYGPLELGLTTDGWGQVYLTNMTLPLEIANAGWTHITVPIDQTKAGLEKVNGYFIKMWSNGAYTNTMSFNVDNIYLAPMTNEPPPEPPTLKLKNVTQGLNFIAAGTGQYNRQNIRAITPDYAWIGHGSTPVTYSFTLTSYPGTNNPSFELHNYLVALPYDQFVGVGTLGTDSAPDWGQTNCIFMDLQNRADGSADWSFRWKTNSIPDGNGTYYSDPLAVLTNTTGPLGTWTLSFVNNTNVTMTSPSGEF